MMFGHAGNARAADCVEKSTGNAMTANLAGDFNVGWFRTGKRFSAGVRSRYPELNDRSFGQLLILHPLSTLEFVRVQL